MAQSVNAMAKLNPPRQPCVEAKTEGGRGGGGTDMAPQLQTPLHALQYAAGVVVVVVAA